MSVVTDIETFVSQLTVAPSFRYADLFEENAQDHLTYPHVQLLEIETGEIFMSATTAGIYDRPNLYIRFLDKSEMDDFARQRDEVVQAMKALAKEFITKINRSGKYEWVERVQWMEVVNVYDTNVSGVEIRFQLRPQAPEGFCV